MGFRHDGPPQPGIFPQISADFTTNSTTFAEILAPCPVLR